jgi:hypothetical protein
VRVHQASVRPLPHTTSIPRSNPFAVTRSQ